MVKRNCHISKLKGSYLFPEINRHKQALLKKHPEANLISLGIGDTTEPIPPSITAGLTEGASKLGTAIGYSGYGPEQGNAALRAKIAKTLYQNRVDPEEIFISDGSKCDIGRLQLLFGSSCTIAVQNPSYPVYVDTAVAMGQTGPFQGEGYEKIVYLNCRPENDFFPDLKNAPKTDLIYFCSPNNPTGAAATREQLAELISFTKKQGSILIFDAAYSAYIRSKSAPFSIYEIPGADEVAIELNSFSKMAGFTGVRLAWAVVPKALRYEEGHSVREDWLRIATTFFNGASNIAQSGGMAALEPQGLIEIRAQTDYYLQNAQLIGDLFRNLGQKVYGGSDAPYIWVHFPGRNSWEVFHELLERCHIVSTPGIGFGPGGEGFLRFSAFNSRNKILEAIERIASGKN